MGTKEKPLSLILCLLRVLRVKDPFAVDSYVDAVYELSRLLPEREKYNLASQIERAATSIVLNIAEDSTGQLEDYPELEAADIQAALSCSYSL